MKRLLKSAKYILKFLPDRMYIQLYYFAKFRKLCNLKNPITFNEKLQWLKLHDRKPIYTTLVDKVEVKKYVADIIGEEYIIPTLGVWNSADDIEFDTLPEQYVLKCNHDSGEVFICKDKKDFDQEYARKRLKKLLKQDFYLVGREWPYKNVKRKILAEKYMENKSGSDLKDYKIFNFNGEPKLIQVDYDRFVSHKRNLYSVDWQYLDVEIAYPSDKKHIEEEPAQLKEMLSLAEKLSKGYAHVRTDFYIIDGKVYFGELTFYHGSGFEKFRPESFNVEMGNWLNLQNEVKK